MRPYRAASTRSLKRQYEKSFRLEQWLARNRYPALAADVRSELLVLAEELDRRGADEKLSKTRTIPLGEMGWFYGVVTTVAFGFGIAFGMAIGFTL